MVGDRSPFFATTILRVSLRSVRFLPLPAATVERDPEGQRRYGAQWLDGSTDTLRACGCTVAGPC